MAKKRRRRPSPTVPGLAGDGARFVEDFQKETDRGAALAAAAFLDEVLEAMLRAFFIDDRRTADRLLEYPGAIAAFAARTDLAYAVGLLGPKMHADLRIIRDIHNRFAHSHHPVTFDDPTVAGLCRKLQAVTLLSLSSALGPRDRFISNAGVLVALMMVRALSVRHAKVGGDFALAQVVRV